MVVIVLGVLVGVALAGVGGLTANADVNACKIEKSTIKKAIIASRGTNFTTDTWSDFVEGGPTAVKWFTVNGTTVTALPGAPCS